MFVFVYHGFMIYVDMDGVLANLDNRLSRRVHGKDLNDLCDPEVQQLGVVFRSRFEFDRCFPEGAEALFRDLDPFLFNETLIRVVLEFDDEYTILSRPARVDPQGSSQGKMAWIKKHLWFAPPREVLLVQDKSADGRPPGNILIDDWDPFLARWACHGGHALKFRAREHFTAESVACCIRKSLSCWMGERETNKTRDSVCFCDKYLHE